MALKFLNKKGWHTGSLRNIENVWKAEQKHGAEQKKLEELRKQIQEERDRDEFRLLQQQAGILPYVRSLSFPFAPFVILASRRPLLIDRIDFGALALPVPIPEWKERVEMILRAPLVRASREQGTLSAHFCPSFFLRLQRFPFARA